MGKTLNVIYIADDQKALKFVFDGGEAVAKTDGDCCSSSYIQHIEYNLKLPATVIAIEDIALSDFPDDSGGRTACYGCSIKTDRGFLFIEYRNESNSYYGGNLCWPGDSFYGGVYDQNVSSENWIKLERDF